MSTPEHKVAVCGGQIGAASALRWRQARPKALRPRNVGEVGGGMLGATRGPPGGGNADRCEYKGVAGKAICKTMKTKGEQKPLISIQAAPRTGRHTGSEPTDLGSLEKRVGGEGSADLMP